MLWLKETWPANLAKNVSVTRFAPVSPSGACLESDDGLVCLCCSLLRCAANGLCKPGDLLIRPHYTAGALSSREGAATDESQNRARRRALEALSHHTSLGPSFTANHVAVPRRHPVRVGSLFFPQSRKLAAHATVNPFPAFIPFPFYFRRWC